MGKRYRLWLCSEGVKPNPYVGFGIALALLWSAAPAASTFLLCTDEACPETATACNPPDARGALPPCTVIGADESGCGWFDVGVKAEVLDGDDDGSFYLPFVKCGSTEASACTQTVRNRAGETCAGTPGDHDGGALSRGVRHFAGNSGYIRVKVWAYDPAMPHNLCEIILDSNGYQSPIMCRVGS